MITFDKILGVEGWEEYLLVPDLLGGPLMVAQWLRYCATNRKVAGSIPDDVIRIFH
jgi:hypothetical protein